MKVGVMGGTFDPLHLGHLILAEQARDALGLDRVLFVPAGEPWRKAGRRIAPVADRVAMVRNALAGDPCFELSTVEAERVGPSYTVETLARLTEQLGPAAALHFILGRDALFDLPHWREPARIVALARLAVAARGDPAEAGRPPLHSVGVHGGPAPASVAAPPSAHAAMVGDLAPVEEAIPGVTARLDVVPMPRVEISSTDIRARVAAGRSIRFLVPAAVEDYIHTRRLYRD